MRVDVDAAAAELWDLFSAGDHGPIQWNGLLKLDDALAVQSRLLDRKIADGEQLVGWKVGLTSPRARAALGSNDRPFGHILRSTTFDSGATVDLSSAHEPHIEPELCFVFARPVDDPSDVEAAVGSVHAGFELNENRPGTTDPDFGLMVADNLAHWGIVVGAGADPRSLDLGSIEVELTCDGESRYTGVSAEALDNHWVSLGRLVEVLGGHSRRIEAGQRVITGAFCRLPCAPGETWTATYSGIGAVEVTFASEGQR